MLNKSDFWLKTSDYIYWLKTPWFKNLEFLFPDSKTHTKICGVNLVNYGIVHLSIKKNSTKKIRFVILPNIYRLIQTKNCEKNQISCSWYLHAREAKKLWKNSNIYNSRFNKMLYGDLEIYENHPSLNKREYSKGGQKFG